MRIDYMLAALLLSIPWVAHAVTEEELFALPLEALINIKVNISTGTPKPLLKAPAATTLITAKDLEALASQDLAEALEAVPGLHASRGGFLYSPRLFIRGIASAFNPQTLVLVNGIPMTSLFVGGRIGLSHGLPVKAVEMVDRIEIIRGPGSAVYGADAFAGVINIITKQPEDVRGGRATLGYGSFETARATLLQGATLGPVRAALSLAYERSDGATAIIEADAQTGIDTLGAPFGVPPASRAPGPVNLGAKDFEARLDLAWGDFLLHTSFGHVWDAGAAQGLSDALDPQGRWADYRGTLDLAWNPAPVGTWELGSRVSYLHSRSYATTPNQFFPPGAFFGAFPEGVLDQAEIREENARLELTAVYTGWNTQRLRLGSGFYWGDLFKTRDRVNYDLSSGIPTPRPGGTTDVSDTPAVFVPEAQRTNSYVFAQDEWAFAPAWELTAGLRYDHYSDFGNTTNPRLALVWTTTPWLTSKLLYGEAFRPPAFSELYASNSPVGLGNPHLKPEKLRNGELAFSVTPSTAWSWDISLYQFRIRDSIAVVNDPSGTFTVQNAGRIRGRGLETELRYQAALPLQALLNYSYQHTEDENTGQPLGLAPRDKVFLRTIWSVRPQWQLSPQLTWIGERQRQAGDTRDDLKGYTSVDLTLRRLQLQKYFALALIGRNLFDADVREPSRGPGPGQTAPNIPNDLPQAGRSVMLEASARW